MLYQLPQPRLPIGGAGTALPPQTYVFPQQQPDLARFAALARPLYSPEPVKRFEGATVQDSAPVWTSQPLRRIRYTIPRAQPRFDGAGVTPPPVIDVFTTAQPPPVYFAFPRALFLTGVRPILESAPKIQTDLFAKTQPEFRAWLSPDAFVRRLGGSRPQVDGATTVVTPSDVFAKTQPELRAWLAPDAFMRRFGGPTPQTSGPVVAQTYLFVISQPRALDYPRLTYPEVRPPQLGAPPVAPQTYEFKVSGPEFRFYVPDANRLQHTGPTPQIDQGKTIQATYIFPVSAPEFQAILRREFWRRFGGSVSFPLDTFGHPAPLVVKFVAEMLRTAGLTSDTVRSAGATNDNLRTAAFNNEED
jgi:hypothetical protein